MDFKNKIFYHGSNNKFITFDKSKIKENKLGLCFNFTDDYSLAYQYGDNILKVKLDLNNPITEDVMKSKWTYEQDELLAKKLGFPSLSEEDFDDNETFGDVYDIFKMNPKFIELLEEMGYDGIAFPEDHHYGVFEPEQIKVLNMITEDIVSLDKFRDDKTLANFKDFISTLIEYGNIANPSNPYQWIADKCKMMSEWNKKDWKVIFKKELTFKEVRDAQIAFEDLADKAQEIADFYTNYNNKKFESQEDDIDFDIDFDNMDFDIDIDDILLNSQKTVEQSIKVDHTEHWIVLDKSVINDNFIKWWGNSYCCNSKGEPIIVYHSTNAEFDTFKNSDGSANGKVYGGGFCFSAYEDYTKDFGKNTMACVLSIQRPLKLSSNTKLSLAITYQLRYKEDWKKYYNDPNHVSRGYLEDKTKNVTSCFQMLNNMGYSFQEIMDAYGYDGIIDGHVFIVVRPNQIKSINNKGTWSKTSDNIYESLNEAGYDWNKGMSNNAVDAYNNGEMPLSKWNKKLLLDTFQKELNNIDNYTQNLYSDILQDKEALINLLKKLPLKELKDILLTNSSYHHTSKFYNITDFYKVDLEYALSNIDYYQDKLKLNEINDKYYYKKKYVDKKNALNRQIDTLTEEQHNVLADLASFRHDFHCSFDSIFNENSIIYHQIDNGDTSPINNYLSENGLPKIEWSVNIEDIPSISWLDIDFDKDINDFNSEEAYESAREEYRNSLYEECYSKLEMLNQDIEKYLRNIDKTYGTNYAPTGFARFKENINFKSLNEKLERYLSKR